MLWKIRKRLTKFVRSKHTSCGLVGYPNVGKSTLFNAMTQTQMAQAANYPFCTIEPNTAKVAVFDEYIERLVNIVKPEKVVPDQIDVWDIAGLIKGASEGAGLGNRFLANIRNVSVIIHVVRWFTDMNISHVDGTDKFDPVKEMEAVKTELILADIETCNKRRKKRGISTVENRVYEKIISTFKWRESS